MSDKVIFTYNTSVKFVQHSPNRLLLQFCNLDLLLNRINASKLLINELYCTPIVFQLFLNLMSLLMCLDNRLLLLLNRVFQLLYLRQILTNSSTAFNQLLLCDLLALLSQLLSFLSLFQLLLCLLLLFK